MTPLLLVKLGCSPSWCASFKQAIMLMIHARKFSAPRVVLMKQWAAKGEFGKLVFKHFSIPWWNYSLGNYQEKWKPGIAILRSPFEFRHFFHPLDGFLRPSLSVERGNSSGDEKWGFQLKLPNVPNAFWRHRERRLRSTISKRKNTVLRLIVHG